MEDEPTDEEIAWSDVYGHLDGTGGLLNALANGLHAAGEAGHPIESHDDRRTDIDNGLQRAFELMDDEGMDADEEEVYEWIDHAASAAGEFYQGLGNDLRNFELPDHVDSGVYGTLGEFTQYVRRDLISVRRKAEEWVHYTE